MPGFAEPAAPDASIYSPGARRHPIHPKARSRRPLRKLGRTGHAASARAQSIRRWDSFTPPSLNSTEAVCPGPTVVTCDWALQSVRGMAGSAAGRRAPALASPFTRCESQRPPP